MLVVVTMVAMVSLPPLIDRNDSVLGHWGGKWAVPRAAFLKVQPLGEGTAEPVDQGKDAGNPQEDAEANEYPAQARQVHFQAIPTRP